MIASAAARAGHAHRPVRRHRSIRRTRAIAWSPLIALRRLGWIALWVMVTPGNPLKNAEQAPPLAATPGGGRDAFSVTLAS